MNSGPGQRGSTPATRGDPVAAGALLRAGPDTLVIAPGDRGERVYVNGLRVALVQAVRPGDVVRVVSPAGMTSFRVPRPRPNLRDGAGLVCRFTGAPVNGPAVVCPCGAAYKRDVIAEIGKCPVCGESLTASDSAPVEAELP